MADRINNTCKKYALKAQLEGANYATGGTYSKLSHVVSGVPESGNDPVTNEEAYTGQEGVTADGIIPAALKSARIPINFLLNPENADVLLDICFGNLTVVETVVGEVYTKTHSLKACDFISSLPGNAAISYFDGKKTRELIGLKGNTWSIKCAGEDQKVTFEAALLGQKTDNDATFPTATQPDFPSYYWGGCSFEIGGSAETGTIRNVEISGNNNLTEHRDGKPELSEPERTAAQPKVKLDILDSNAGLDWRNIHKDQILNQFQFSCTNTKKLGDDATYPSVTIEFDQCRVVSVSDNDSKTGLKMWSVQLEPVADSTTKVYGTVTVVDHKSAVS